jgi:hypothetical protein
VVSAVTRAGALVVLLAATACVGETGQVPAPIPAAPPAFVNRVWKVAESTAMTPGQLVTFLSDGTLIFADANSKPAFGTWSYDGRELTMVEEGVPYRVEILSLSDTELRLRSHNPGGFVDTRFVDGEEPLPEVGSGNAPTATTPQ